MKNPILIALDTSDLHGAARLADRVSPVVGGFKVGLELIMSNGPDAVSRIAEIGLPVFADVKLHDIPNTVERAASQLSARGARWVTVHGSGGSEMVRAAVNGLVSADEPAGCLVVSVLTSLDDDGLAETGVTRTLQQQVATMSEIAVSCGAEGVVCSPHEAPVVKRVSNSLLAVTPGVRLEGGEMHDQKRVKTPAQALANGADILVVGRAVTGSPEPERVAAEIVASLGAESRN